MDYQFKKFTIPLTSDAYASGWDRIFGKKPGEPKHLTCDDCGRTDKTVEDVFCPYAQDVHGEDVEMNLCTGCYNTRCEDI